jgi:uncharacterized Fe-S cluster protein YjdI
MKNVFFVTKFHTMVKKNCVKGAKEVFWEEKKAPKMPHF